MFDARHALTLMAEDISMDTHSIFSSIWSSSLEAKSHEVFVSRKLCLHSAYTFYLCAFRHICLTTLIFVPISEKTDSAFYIRTLIDIRHYGRDPTDGKRRAKRERLRQNSYQRPRTGQSLSCDACLHRCECNAFCILLDSLFEENFATCQKVVAPSWLLYEFFEVALMAPPPRYRTTAWNPFIDVARAFAFPSIFNSACLTWKEIRLIVLANLIHMRSGKNVRNTRLHLNRCVSLSLLLVSFGTTARDGWPFLPKTSIRYANP